VKIYLRLRERKMSAFTIVLAVIIIACMAWFTVVMGDRTRKKPLVPFVIVCILVVALIIIGLFGL